MGLVMNEMAAPEGRTELLRDYRVHGAICWRRRDNPLTPPPHSGQHVSSTEALRRDIAILGHDYSRMQIAHKEGLTRSRNEQEGERKLQDGAVPMNFTLSKRWMGLPLCASHPNVTEAQASWP